LLTILHHNNFFQKEIFMKRFVLFFILLSTPVFSSQSEGLPAEVVYKMLHNCSVGGRYSFFRTIQKALDADRCETISIAPGTYYENLSIHRSVTLTGASGDSSDVIIDGGAAGKVINVTTGSLSITLKNLTLQNGSASSGSAFYATGGVDLTLKNVIVQNNAGTGSVGAIYVVPQTSVVLDTVTCSGNSALPGTGTGGCLLVGGEDDDDTVSISNSTFSENTSNTGGAVYFSSVNTVNISNSTFENNTAQEDGGAIVYINTDGIGGVFTMEDSTCKNNESNWEDGGCLWVKGNESELDGEVKIKNTSFSGNIAESFGGAVFTQALNVSFSSDTSFDGNTSGSYGGGYAGYNPGTVTLSIDDTEFTNNESETGGGLWVTYFETVSISQSVFDDNTANVSGGALNFDGITTAKMDTSTLSNNRGGQGGGISATGSGTLELTNLLFYKNMATDTAGGGGAISNTDLVEMHVSNSTFSENSALNYGGAIYIDSPDLASSYLTNVTIYKNRAKNGGGLFVGVTNTFYAKRTVFAENEEASDGNCQIAGTLVSYGYNRDTDSTCNLTEDTDDTITDAGLEALADNGGPTQTHMLSSDSVLIDAGGSDCSGTDQRGASWPVDGDASTTAECDIGAVEYGSTP